MVDDEFNALQGMVDSASTIIRDGLSNYQELPLWAQAADSFLAYNPETVLFQIREWDSKLRGLEDQQAAITAIAIGANRIARFGAGPALDKGLLSLIRTKVAESLEHPQWLLADLNGGPMEPTYYAAVGHQKGEWPILVLPEQFYSPLAIQSR